MRLRNIVIGLLLDVAEYTPRWYTLGNQDIQQKLHYSRRCRKILLIVQWIIGNDYCS